MTDPSRRSPASASPRGFGGVTTPMPPVPASLGKIPTTPAAIEMCERMAAKVEFAPEADPVAEYWDLVRGDDLWWDDRSYIDYQIGEPPEDEVPA